MEISHTKLTLLQYEIEKELLETEGQSLNDFQLGMYTAMSNINKKLQEAIGEIHLIGRPQL
jgi:hypothetical protein